MTSEERLVFIQEALVETDYDRHNGEYQFTNNEDEDKGAVYYLAIERESGDIQEATIYIDDDGNVEDYSQWIKYPNHKLMTDDIVKKIDSYLIGLAKEPDIAIVRKRKTRVALATYIASVCPLSANDGNQITLVRPVGGLLGSPIEDKVIADVNTTTGKFDYSWFSNADDCDQADQFIQTYAYELLCKATNRQSGVDKNDSWLR